MKSLERDLTALQGADMGDVTAVFLSAANAKGKLLDEAASRAEEILERARSEAEVARSGSHSGLSDEAGQSSISQAVEEAYAIEIAAREIARKIKTDAVAEARTIVNTAKSEAGGEGARAARSPDSKNHDPAERSVGEDRPNDDSGEMLQHYG